MKRDELEEEVLFTLEDDEFDEELEEDRLLEQVAWGRAKPAKQQTLFDVLTPAGKEEASQ